MPTVYIRTYGCQMNERDSEAVAAQLVAKGYDRAPSEHVADVILLNTCSVRDMADQKAFIKMESIAETRRTRPKPCSVSWAAWRKVAVASWSKAILEAVQGGREISRAFTLADRDIVLGLAAFPTFVVPSVHRTLRSFADQPSLMRLSK